MRYEPLEEAGTLGIDYKGPPLDLYAIGVLQVNFQEIVDKVAYWVSAEAGLQFPDRRRQTWTGLPPWQPSPLFVRTQLRSISVGSFSQEVVFAVASVIADLDMKDVLHGLAANIVWAIIASGIRGLRHRDVEPSRPIRNFWRNRRDPADIRPNLRAMTLGITESVPCGQAEIRIKSKGPGGEVEVTINIDNKEDGNSERSGAHQASRG